MAEPVDRTELLPVAACTRPQLDRAGVRVAARADAAPGTQICRPWHPYTWVCLTTAGSARWRCRESGVERTGEVRRGMLLVFPRTVPYWVEAGARGWGYVWFSVDAHARPDLRHAALSVPPPLRAELVAAVDGLLREWRARTPDREQACALQAGLLVLHLHRLLGPRPVPGQDDLEALIVRISCAPHAPWSVATLAEALGLSERQTHRAIRRQCTCSPGQLVRRLRLQAAQRLLAQPRLRLEAIARAVGYADASALAHAFRRTHGLSPVRWGRRAAGRASRAGMRPHG